jgi:hypothetical protein
VASSVRWQLAVPGVPAREVIDPDTPIPYQLTELARRELAEWRDQVEETDCPRHEWEYAIGRGLVCQNCNVVAMVANSIPSYLGRRDRKWR